MNSGYSGKPLKDKLGIKPGMKVYFYHCPTSVSTILQYPIQTYEEVKIIAAPIDCILCFVTAQSELEGMLVKLREHLLPTGMIWICWPKQTSGIPTDVSENRIRDIGLSVKLVDVKVCALDEIWSGLKFVIRLRDRDHE